MALYQQPRADWSNGYGISLTEPAFYDPIRAQLHWLDTCAPHTGPFCDAGFGTLSLKTIQDIRSGQIWRDFAAGKRTCTD